MPKNLSILFFRKDTRFISLSVYAGAKFSVMVPFAGFQTITAFLLFLTPSFCYSHLKRGTPDSSLSWAGDKRHPHQNFKVIAIQNCWMLHFLHALALYEAVLSICGVVPVCLRAQQICIVMERDQ